MNASNKKTTSAHTGVPTIQAINDAYRRVLAAHKAFTTACRTNGKDIAKRDTALSKALRAFDGLKAKRPHVKFDYLLGTYFDAAIKADGKDTFHIAVENRSRVIKCVKASSLDEAMRIAQANGGTVIRSLGQTVNAENVGIV